MLKPFLLVVAFMLLPACSAKTEPEGPKAERELAILQSTGPSKDEECTAKRKVAEAYLRDQNADEYRKADLFADVACTSADLERRM